jgi:protein TonB
MLSVRDRAATVTAVILVHAALLLALLSLSDNVRTQERDVLTQLIAIATEPPPPPVVDIQPEQAKPKKAEGAASARNIESQATPVVAPKPIIPVPTPQPIAASPTPRTGADATQGASNVVGPGTGAGGAGNGTGSGGAGSGSGGGGEGLAAIRTRLATRPLSGRDFPNELLDRWPPGRPAYMRFRVDSEGRIIQCIVDVGTGDQGVDAAICATAQARLHFYPGVASDGRRVADWFAYGQRPPR